MRKEEILILERSDMYQSPKSKYILLVELKDFNIETKEISDNTIVLFIDDDGKTKILKNKYGDNGNTVFIDVIEDIKQNNLDNDLGFGERYFNDIIEILK